MKKFLVCAGLLAEAAAAQGTRVDYARAERFVSRDPIVFEAQVGPHWIGKQSRFWYRRAAPEGSEFLLVDANARERKPAFDHERLAEALSRASGKAVSAKKLPFEQFEYTEEERAIAFEIESARWICTLDSYQCRGTARDPGLEIASPDKKWIAFQRDHNLYVRHVETNEQIRLSHDGGPLYDYSAALPQLRAMVEQGTTDVAVAPSVRWSPDSKKILAYRLDRRSAREFTVVQSVPKLGLRPVRYTYPYPLPGEIGLTRAEPVIFDISSRKRVAVETEPLDLLYTGGPRFDWFEDSSRVYYVHTRRGYQSVQLREIDAATGAVRVLVDERSETFVDPGMTYFRLLEGSGEVIWSSERDGWCHLYLYDLKTAKLKSQVTRGPWVVRGIVRVDEKARSVWFTASGREAGRDPYLLHVYRANLDGGNVRLLTPEDAEHTAGISPSGEYFVDTYSRANLAPVAVLRRASDGGVAMELERAAPEPLLRAGWKWPEPFQALAADGKTDIYGVIYRPSNFDPAKKYPVIEEIYMGPQAYTTPKPFRARSAAQAIAELGFIVVILDGRGMGKRSKAFHDFCYKNLGNDTGLADHMAGIKQLAERYPYMDLTRVGIYGHSAGGYDSTHALLTQPEFYKVAVSSSGNHDHRMDKAWWNELWMGYPAGEHYQQQSNVALAAKLQGKLMLAHGELDDNVHPASTLQLVDALIKANKDFDLLILPGENHGIGASQYFIRRRWDFFVRHLLGVEPRS
jgi:dipeptidyl-peptidase 4